MSIPAAQSRRVAVIELHPGGHRKVFLSGETRHLWAWDREHALRLARNLAGTDAVIHERTIRGSTMSIADAQAVIQAEAEKITAKLHAKGYVDAHAEIWVGRDRAERCVIYIKNEPPRMTYHTGSDLFAILTKVHEDIASLTHKDAEAMAYAEEMAAPLYLMSEQPLAIAAE